MFCCGSDDIATSCCFPSNPRHPRFASSSSSPHFKNSNFIFQPIDTDSVVSLNMNRVAVCIKEGEDGATVVAVVPRGHVASPYIPLDLSVPARTVFSDCVAIAARVNCDGTVTSLGAPRDLPPSSSSSKTKTRQFDHQAIKDAVSLFGPFKQELTQEYLSLFGIRVLDRPYLLLVSGGDKTLELPFGHSIYRATKTDWVAVTPSNFVSLSTPTNDNTTKRPQLSKKDLTRLDHFLKYDWGENDSFLFSDAVNVCSVFPFVNQNNNNNSTTNSGINSTSSWCKSQRKDELGCDWGETLRQPFDDASVGQLCTPFSRGFALGTIFTVAPPRKSSQPPGANNNNTNATSTTTTTTTKVEPTSEKKNSTSTSTPPAKDNNTNNNIPVVNVNNINPNENLLFFFMMGTQHSGNPGPRFFGRGINDDGHVGNDLVYQLVAWKYVKKHDNNNNNSTTTNPNNSESSLWDVQWSRHCFLRGTVPLKFKNKLAKGIGEASIVLMDDALEGSAEYLTAQVEKCNLISNLPVAAPSAADQSNTTTNNRKNENATNKNDDEETTTTTNNNNNNNKYESYPKLRCINLLKSVSKAGEDRLGALFDQSVKRVSAENNMPIDIEHIDWLGLEAKFGIEASALRIWNVALLFLDGEGQRSRPCSAGSFSLQRQPNGNTNNYTNNYTVTQQQSRYVRYNCADSLDRTNLASFFVVSQLCSRLFLLLDVMPERLQLNVSANPLLYETAPTPKRPDSNNSFGELADIKEDLDQLSEIPPETELPPCFYHSIQDFSDNMPEPLMQALVEIFITNGDTIAKLFTSTGAIHTSHMRKFVVGMRSAPANAILSAQRRFENIFRDRRKYRVVDTLIGKRTKSYHFPTIPQHYFVWPLPRKQWPNALVVKIPSCSRLVGASALKKALFPDDEEKQSKIVSIREGILSVEREISINTATISQPNLLIASNNNNSIAKEKQSPTAVVVSPPLSPSSARSSSGSQQGDGSQTPHGNNNNTNNIADDDVPKDVENPDFSFIRFNYFYVAVVLFDTPAVPASILASDPSKKDIPFYERKVDLALKLSVQDGMPPVSAVGHAKYYIYEQATEETSSCLKVRQAAEVANAASPLVKISNFAKNLFGGGGGKDTTTASSNNK